MMAAIATLLLSGCLTLSEHERRELQGYQLPAPLYQKMVRRESLALDEIIQLSAKKVPPHSIIRYVDDSLAVYQLTTNEVLLLRNSGVSHEVIDFLLATPRLQPTPVIEYGYGPDYYRPVIIHHHHRH